MVNDQSTFDHHLFEVARARRVGRVPAHAHQHDLQRAVLAPDDLAKNRRCELNVERNHTTYSHRTTEPAYCDGNRALHSRRSGQRIEPLLVTNNFCPIARPSSSILGRVEQHFGDFGAGNLWQALNLLRLVRGTHLYRLDRRSIRQPRWIDPCPIEARCRQASLGALLGDLPAGVVDGHAQGVWVAGLGAIFILGRFIYLRAYTRDPASRSAGFALSIGPSLILLMMALVGR